jgi:hypothetical protein
MSPGSPIVTALFAERTTMRLDRVRAVAYALGSTVCALWLVYLFCQTGSTWDESEHAHVAWLISRGKRPIDDFFQHHTPLLWYLLAVYYRLGFSGAGVLIWGRVLVVLSAIASVVALLHLGRTPRAPRVNIAGMAGMWVFIGLTFLLPELFVSRPETLATAFMLVALALWSAETRAEGLRVLIAGALAGVACFASPRFLLLGGFFFLRGANSMRRWGVLVLGGAASVAAFMAISAMPLEHVLFVLRFSSFLQSVGSQASGLSEEFWMLLAAAVIVPMLPLIMTVGSTERVRCTLLIVNLGAIFVVCGRLAGEFRYEQAYAPFIAGAAFVATSLLASYEVAPGWRMVAAPLLSVFLLFASVNELHARAATPGFILFEQVRAKNALAALVPPGRTVLVYTATHPITVEDASYYGSPLWDAQNRLCLAIQGFRSSISLPPCDFFRDIQRTRPYILDARIEKAVKLDEVAALRQWLDENYERLRLPNASSLKTRSRYPLLVEKSGAATSGYASVPACRSGESCAGR